jgi:PKD repeat protein
MWPDMKNINRSLLPLLVIFLITNPVFCQNQENYAKNIVKKILMNEAVSVDYEITPVENVKSFYVVFVATYNGEKINISEAHGTGHRIPPGKNNILWYFTNDFRGENINKVDVNVYAYKEMEPKALAEIDTITNKGYAPCEVRFKNNSTDATSYEWDFGDVDSKEKNFTNERDPVHTYTKGKLYHVKLSAISTVLDIRKDWTYDLVIKEYDSTIARFEIEYDENIPFNVRFKNYSEHADTFLWTFGDKLGEAKNNVSSLKEPSHQYKMEGDYAVKLIVKSSLSGYKDTISKLVHLKPLPPKPPQLPDNSQWIKAAKQHKTIKTACIASAAVTGLLGGYSYLNANKLYNDYKVAQEDAVDIIKKVRLFDKITPVSLVLAGASVAEVIIQGKKQKEAEKKISLRMVPAGEGAALGLTINF